MGNEKASEYRSRYFSLCHDHLSDEESENYPKSLPDEIIFMLVDRCYKELIGLAFSLESRLAFQVLGDFLMYSGAKMTNDLKIIILKNSRWNDDRKQLKNKKERLERRKYLFQFRECILTYQPGVKIELPHESVTQVCNRELEKQRKIIPNLVKYIQRTPILK